MNRSLKLHLAYGTAASLLAGSPGCHGGGSGSGTEVDPTYCVAAGTRIATPGGWVAVEALRPGDPLFAVDTVTGGLVATTLKAVRRGRRECLALQWGGDRELVVTPDHPIFAPQLRAFVDAGRFALAEVSTLLVFDSLEPEGRAREVEVAGRRLDAGVHEVFDLTVEGDHPTFVAEGVVVHNKSTCVHSSCEDPSVSWGSSSGDWPTSSSSSSSSSSTTEPTTGEVEDRLWSAAFGGPGSRVIEQVLVVAPQGDAIVAGRVAGVIDFGDGPLGMPDLESLFAVRHDADGQREGGDIVMTWPEGQVSGLVAVFDPTMSRTFLAGSFVGDLKLGAVNLPWVEGSELEEGVETPTRDVFVLELHGTSATSGLRFGGSGDERVAAIAVDADGRVVLAGDFTQTAEFQTETLMSAGAEDLFVVQFSKFGMQAESAVRFGGPGAERMVDAAIDGAGDLALVGSAPAELDLGGGPLAADPAAPGFVAKIGLDGTHRWSARLGASQEPRAIAAAASGEVAVTGREFYGDDAAGFDVFTSRFTGDGALKWSVRAGPGAGESSLGADVAFNAAGDAIVTGEFTRAVDFGGALLSTRSETEPDVFVAAYGSEGALRHVVQYGDAAGQGGTGVVVTPGQHVLLTGHLRGSIDFGTGTHAQVGELDLFVAEVAP